MKLHFSLAAVLAAALLVLLAGPASAAKTPRTLPGWPQAVPAEVLLPGPGGGVVAVGTPANNDDVRVVIAYRLDGRRLWSYQASCGRCRPGGSQPTALQADGTYGPVGGLDAWSVDKRGRRAARCLGLVLADSTCITATSFDVPSWETPHPGFAATNTAVPWTAFDAGHLWLNQDNSPTTVRDGAGLVYAGFPSPSVPGADALSGVLMAADPATHALAWTRVGPYEALGGFASGVLAGDPGRVVSIGPDGAERWGRSFPWPRQALIDEARDRVYVSSQANPRVCDETAGTSPNSPACAWVVRALRASTGATVWRTKTSDSATLMSVGRGGRVYLGLHASGRSSVRAVRFTNGSTVWQHDSRRPIVGVLELANGTVAISSQDYGGDDRLKLISRLTIVDPR